MSCGGIDTISELTKSLEYNRRLMTDEALEKQRPQNEKRRKLTSELRERWLNYSRKPDIGHCLSPHRLPLHILRRNRNAVRETNSAQASLFQWMSEEEKEKRKNFRTDFEKQWKHEVLKKDTGYQTRLPYVRAVSVPSRPPPVLTYCSNIDSQPFFYSSNSPRPKSQKDKERMSRHFIHPEWKSETISWTRFDQPHIRNIHRLSLF